MAHIASGDDLPVSGDEAGGFFELLRVSEIFIFLFGTPRLELGCEAITKNLPHGA